jgi:hypothetical protein
MNFEEYKRKLIDRAEHRAELSWNRLPIEKAVVVVLIEELFRLNQEIEELKK